MFEISIQYPSGDDKEAARYESRGINLEVI